MKPQKSFLEIVADVRAGTTKLSEIRTQIRKRVERFANDKDVVFDPSHRKRTFDKPQPESKYRKVHIP